MSEVLETMSRRSSSQTSRNSGESKKAKTVRNGPRRNGSKASVSNVTKTDPSLTSFPSFSPEPESQEIRKEALIRQEAPHAPARTVSQKVRQRKQTLAGLTNASPALDQRALFDDSPRSSLDVPGSLHLASDDHIERLIARTGAVKLIRQYAGDMARRDAEISALRIRADNRERELKKMLREADVTSADIEKRLLRLEQISHTASNDGNTPQGSALITTLDGMMNEALSEQMAASPSNDVSSMEVGFDSYVSGARTRDNSGANAPLQSSDRSSRNTSRANSILSQSSHDLDATVRPKGSNSNLRRASGLQNLFQPPQSASYFIGGAKTMKKSRAGDEMSVKSSQSSKSFASWTKIFGGTSQAARSRSSSLDQPELAKGPGIADSAVASLQKVRTTSDAFPPKGTASSNTIKRPTPRRIPTATRLSTSPSHARKDSNASSLPPTVELDSMIESSELPPTMTSRHIETDGILTDRFGFIYDQKRRKRQSLQVQQHKKNQLSGAETIASFRSDETSSATNSALNGDKRPATPQSMDEEGPKKSWQDYLKVPSNIGLGRPKELLSHTPSASAVVTVHTADATGSITPPRHRERSASISGQKALPSGGALSRPPASGITAEFDHDSVSEAGPSKLLLEQLMDMHDQLQAEREVKWNDFLRRVRAERANSTDRSRNNAPEADLLDGELIGMASLGRSKHKYLAFKNLVLGGIPVKLRPKIWAECSTATALRIPDYYDDLVRRSEEDTDMDAEIASQIKADIRRTLTDNVMFRKKTGVQKLEEVLRVYSLHNPRIGYCQGMNLITASLLLICKTNEECFWLLVVSSP